MSEVRGPISSSVSACFFAYSAGQRRSVDGEEEEEVEEVGSSKVEIDKVMITLAW